jgi:hypothetical protein
MGFKTVSIGSPAAATITMYMKRRVCSLERYADKESG